MALNIFGGSNNASVKTFDEFQSSSYFSALDGLRAISILLVLLHHTVSDTGGRLVRTLAENGRYGVGFFFLISGFLICTLFLRERTKTGEIHLWKFYGRRAVRLLPLYFAVLFLQAILVFGLHQYSAENQLLFREKLPSYIFYYSNWLPTSTQGPFFCAWSLAVEEQFYLLFGLLIFFARRPVVILAVFTALVLKILVYQIFGIVDASSALFRVLFSYREPILLGVLIAFAMDLQSGYQLFRKWQSSAWTVAAVGLATFLWIGFHVMRHESTWDSQILYLLMGLTLIGVVMRFKTPLLSGRVLTHIGKISYGIYLLHMFVISSVRKLPGGNSELFCFATAVVGTVFLATLSYYFFEQPLIARFKKRLTPAAKPVIAPAELEPVPPVLGLQS